MTSADYEVFYVGVEEFEDPEPDTWMEDHAQQCPAKGLAGWYWWFCQPGCLPDSHPVGPYSTEHEATQDVEEELEELYGEHS